MSKAKKIFTNWRMIILIVAFLLSVVAINPDPWQEGVAIRSIASNSSASDAGIDSPLPTISPRSREVILTINNQPIQDVEDYYAMISTLPINQTISIRTTEQTYLLQTKEKFNITYTGRNVTREIVESVFNETLNETTNITRMITEPEVLKESTGRIEDLGITVYSAPKSNIRQGLDLTGGTRVILKPEEKIPPEDMDFLLANMRQRLDVFGLSDVRIRDATDLSGETFVVVEIAGATQEEVSELLARQGKFEAKIGNATVFSGGDDITYVYTSADQSGIDPRQGCSQTTSAFWRCGFYFQIKLSPEAAQLQADVTSNLSVITDEGGSYLSQPLDLYLDDELVDSLQIAAGLQGRPVTDISITGGGNGTSREAAQNDALQNMKKLQTILKTGSLPVKLEIERVDNISPVLGEEFLQNAILIGLLALSAVILTVFIRYRRFVISIPMIVAMTSEAVIVLGFAALIGWNIDLAAIAGIIIAIGTGVDDQIVIADETLTKRGKASGKNWKERMKRAFFIIFAAYFTLVVAMIPLWFAGAGMLKGFAITTIAGVSIGVLITRPAYAKLIEIFTEN